MWAALLGAVVGGFFALAGSCSLEFRRDHRRRIAAARLVLAELDRSDTEIFGRGIEAKRQDEAKRRASTGEMGAATES